MDEITSNQETEKKIDEVISTQENKKSVGPQKPTNPPTTASSPPPAKVSRPAIPIVVELQYRLNVFSHTENVKPSISAPVYQDMCRRHGDIMRSVSSTK